MSAMKYSCLSYAKINFTLDILGKYPNGYHQMDMVMSSVSLADKIDLQVVPGGQVQVICPQLPQVDPAQNIAARCATAFFQRTGIADGCTICIQKEIPSQAGLGGGSGDGAAVLNLLNRHYHNPLSKEQLNQVGAAIGADIPFMLVGGLARVGGIGEQVVPIKSALPPLHLVIAKPPVGISTGRAFAAFDGQTSPVHPNTSAMVQAVQEGDVSGVGRHMLNVMQLALPHPQVEQAVDFLRDNGAINAIMTGSGSAVFGVFDTQQQAQHCCEQYKKAYPTHFVFTCHTCDMPFCLVE